MVHSITYKSSPVARSPAYLGNRWTSSGVRSWHTDCGRPTEWEIDPTCRYLHRILH
jgi:hypothetical protein